MIGNAFWAYAGIAFAFLLIFILPLLIGIRELVLLRRYDRERAGEPDS